MELPPKPKGTWKRTDFLIQILAGSATLDGPSTWEVSEGRGFCSWRHCQQFIRRKLLGIFFGTLPWLHRYHQGHQNISTFVTCSLLPNSEFGSFMITPSGFVSLKLDLGLFFPPYIPVFPRVCIFRFDTKNPVFQNNRMLPLRNPLTITEKGIGKMHPVPSPFKTMTVLLHLGLEHSWKTMC